MRLWSTCCVLFFICLYASTAQATSNMTFVADNEGQNNEIMMKDTETIQLTNGLRVIVKTDRRFPMVSTRLMVHAGSAYETPKQAGISHVLEHMVFKGTTTRPKGEISRVVEAAGGYLNAGTGFDYTQYIVDLPAREWRLGIDVVRDMAFHATIDAVELESEKQVVLAELQRGEDSPHGRLFKLAQTALLQGTPYGHPIIGYEETVKSFTVQDIKDYIQTYYQPNNMQLVVVGDIDAAEVFDEAERLFGAYTNKQPLKMVQPVDIASLKQHVGQANVTVQTGPWNKVYLALTLPVPGFTDFDSTPLDVLAYMLGGDETGYLYRTYKNERQLVDSISAANIAFERVGIFLITAELDAKNLDVFWKALSKDLQQLNGARFTEQERERAKVNLVDSLYRAKETLPSLASNLSYFSFFLGGEQGELNAVQAAQAVDGQAIEEVITEWLNPARLAVVALEPESATSVTRAATLASVLQEQWPAEATQQSDMQVMKGTTERIDLGKGRSVVFISDTTRPYFSMELVFSGGEALLNPQEQGLAVLTASTLATGTATLDNAAIQRFFSDRAAGFGAASTRRTFRVGLDGATRFMGELLPLFSEIIQAPAFNTEDFLREQQSQISTIKSVEDQPLGLAFRKLSPFLFPDSVYGYESLGSIDGLEKMKREQVRGFWDRQKVRPWVLAVSGDFDKETVLAFAKTLPVPTEHKVNIPVPTWTTKKTLELILQDRQQAHLLLLFKTAPQTSPDTPALQMTQSALDGMGGPLFSKLRDEQGLGYTVTVFNAQSDDLGYMAFYIGTSPEQLEQAKTGFVEIITDLHNNLLPKADLQRGYNQLENQYYRAMQSLGARSAEAATLLIEDRPLDFAKKELEHAAKVTPEGIRDVVKKYLSPDNAYIITVHP